MRKKKLRKLVKKLKKLIQHCWVHSGYEDCGWRQMDSGMRKLYSDVIGRNNPTNEPCEYPGELAFNCIKKKGS